MWYNQELNGSILENTGSDNFYEIPQDKLIICQGTIEKTAT